LRPFQPYLVEFAKLIGIVLVESLIHFVKITSSIVIGTINLLAIGIEKAMIWVDRFVRGWDFTITIIMKTIDAISFLIRKIKELVNLGGGGLVASALGFGGNRASGGSVSAGTTYMVGERGPELFTPSRSGNIIPNHSLGGAGGGITVNVTVNGDVSGRDLVDKVQQAIMNSMRSNQLLPL
jgi:hypothetical protein